MRLKIFGLNRSLPHPTLGSLTGPFAATLGDDGRTGALVGKTCEDGNAFRLGSGRIFDTCADSESTISVDSPFILSLFGGAPDVILPKKTLAAEVQLVGNNRGIG